MESSTSYYDVAKDFELGHFTVDLSKFKAEVREPLMGRFGHFDLYEASPPPLGFAVLLAVRLSTPMDKPLGFTR